VIRAEVQPPLASTTLRAVVVTLVVALAVALSSVVVRGWVIVLTLFGAVIVGEALRPFVDRLSARMPRGAATALSFVALLAAIAIIWLIPIRALAPQAVDLWQQLPGYAADAAARIATFSHSDAQSAKIVSDLSAGAASSIGAIAGGFFAVQASVASILGTLGLMLVMALFWLGASARLMAFISSIVSPEHRPEVCDLFVEIGGKLGQYVNGTIANGIMVGAASTIVLWLFGAPYPVVFGLLQGLLTALPYLGTFIGVLVVFAVVLGTHGWAIALATALSVALVQMIQGTFVAPLVFKKGLDLDPLFTVTAIALGGALFGVLGVLLAVPAASVVQTVVVRVVAPAIRSTFANPPSGEVR
jgi:predicted PurR-regulated permease PerM